GRFRGGGGRDRRRRQEQPEDALRSAEGDCSPAGCLGLGGGRAGGAGGRLPGDGDVRDAEGEAAEMSAPAIITAAICGAETTRAQTPYLPITAEELAEEAAR